MKTAKCHHLPIDTPAKLALLWNQEICPLKSDPVPGMEAMAAVYLDEDVCLMDWTILGVGILGVTADVRVIVAEGGKLKARAFAVIHNHPPGYSLAPSKEDLETVRFLEAEVATDEFRFYDSIIVNALGWSSIKQDRWKHWGSPTADHRIAKKGGAR